MKIHFIAIGGAIMHNLAIALKQKGYEITGSDDVIFDPSKSLLEKNGLLPSAFGFFSDKITKEIDAIILGMHAKMDNPELARAMELGIKVYSFPEFIYEQSKDKKRVVVAGSHGKTTTTSMLMHILKDAGFDFDYMVGSSVAGFDNNVKVTDAAPITVLEGDEYLTSTLDREPKFIHYKPHLAILTGIAWDHINVFPTFEIYLEQFKKLIRGIEPNGVLVYYKHDEHIQKIIAQENRTDIQYIPYEAPNYIVEENQTYLKTASENIPLEIFGKHNLENLEAAKIISEKLGVSETAFYRAASTFSGAGKRLEKILEENSSIVFRDFAHSPSKLTATVKSAKEQFPIKKIVACMELHTFSSLKKEFLAEYAHALDAADVSVVYVDEQTVKQKGSGLFSEEEIKNGFQLASLKYATQKENLQDILMQEAGTNTVFLLMSSGHFGGLDIKKIASELVREKNNQPIFPKVENKPFTEQKVPSFTIDATEENIQITEEDKSLSVLLHASLLFAPVILSLIFYVLNKEKRNTIFKVAKETLNYQITVVLIYYLSKAASWFSFFELYSGYLLIIFMVFCGGLAILGAYKAFQKTAYKYPLNFNFIK